MRGKINYKRTKLQEEKKKKKSFFKNAEFKKVGYIKSTTTNHSNTPKIQTNEKVIVILLVPWQRTKKKEKEREKIGGD